MEAFMSDQPITSVCLVLDRSGSMQAVHADALGSVNSYIEAAQKDEALKAGRFTLIAFSSDGIDVLRKDQPIADIRPLTAAEYQCNGYTPLYDAIGRGIGVLDQVAVAKCALVILTDGLENSSGEFTHESITTLIKQRQERGWLVSFLGEGLDVAQQGMHIGTASAHVAAYAGGIGLRAAGRVMASTTSRYAVAADFAQALDAAALTPEERDALAGKGG
jgi:Mg-chelatase subunit ChlD